MDNLTVPIKVELPDNWVDLIVERLKQDGDWVEVVRCKDCIYGKAHDMYGLHICEAFDDVLLEDNGFCCYGEREANE